MRVLVFLIGLSVAAPVFANFGAALQDGFVEVQGNSSFTNVEGQLVEDFATDGISVTPDSLRSTGSGSTSTGGIGGTVSYALNVSNRPDRIVLSFVANGVAQATLFAGESGSVGIDLATAEIGNPGHGIPIILRLTSEFGRMPFNVLERSVEGPAFSNFFSMTPPPVGGFIVPGDYALDFHISARLNAVQSDRAISSVTYTAEILIPEPVSTTLTLTCLSALAMARAYRRACLVRN